MKRGWVIALLGAVGLWAAAPPARAFELSSVRGHMTLGYSHLSVSDTSGTPGGSLSFGAGVDLPLASRLRAGVGMGYHVLGSRTLVQGTLSSGIDYSVFEATAMVHWSPLHSGPDLIVSAGPGLFHAKAELAATSVGLAFTPQAIDETAFGAALDVSVVRRKPTPVRAGVVAGLRYIPLDHVNWTVASIGIALIY